MGRTAVMVIQRIAVREVFPTTKKKKKRERMHVLFEMCDLCPLWKSVKQCKVSSILQL